MCVKHINKCMDTILMVQEKVTKVTFNADNRVLKEMKHLAIDIDITLTDAINQAMEEYIQKRKKGVGRK